MARLSPAVWRGKARAATLWLGTGRLSPVVRNAERGQAGPRVGLARLGMAVACGVVCGATDRKGRGGPGLVGPGKDWQAERSVGPDGNGTARLSPVVRGAKQRLAGHGYGLARPGWARQGWRRHGCRLWCGVEGGATGRTGEARLGWARNGCRLWCGVAWFGPQRLAMQRFAPARIAMGWCAVKPPVFLVSAA